MTLGDALDESLDGYRALIAAGARLPLKLEMSPPDREVLDEDPDAVFWIECVNLASESHLEAVKVLALLANVDFERWKAFVRGAWPGDATWVDWLDSRASLRVGLRVVISDESRDVARFCRVIVDSLTGPRSDEYAETLKLLKQVAGRPMRELPVVPVWLDCVVGADWEDEPETDIDEDFDDEEEDGDLSDHDHEANEQLERDGDQRDGGGDEQERQAADDEDRDVQEYAAYLEALEEALEARRRRRDAPRPMEPLNRAHQELGNGEGAHMVANQATGDDDAVDAADGDADEHLYTLVTLLTAIHRALARQAKHRANLMRVTRFSLTAHREITLNEAALACVLSMRNLGVHVSAIPRLGLNDDGDVCTDAVQCFRSLQDVNGQPTETVSHAYRTRGSHGLWRTAIGPGVEHITVHHFGAVARFAAIQVTGNVLRVLSAMQASRSLRSVACNVGTRRISTTRSEGLASARRQLIRWLTFGLFNRAPLDTIDLDASALRMEDVESIAEMWNASNPLKLLFPDDDVSKSRAVTTSRVYVREPVPGELPSAASVWVEPESVELAVLGGDRNGFFPVLLPGWGKAWVKYERGRTVVRKIRRKMAFTSPTHMAIRRSKSPDTLVAFLRVVGRHLKHLTIRELRFADSATSSSLGNDVVKACPILQALELPGQADFAPIDDAFRMGLCSKLERLALVDVRLSEAGEAVPFLTALADPKSVIARQLIQVRLAITGDTHRATLDSALAVLRTNTRLRDISFHFGGIADALLIEYASQFQAFSVSSAIEPLPSQAVLAFLSAAQTGVPRRDLDGALSQAWSAFERFDSRLLSLVIAFAGTRHTRCVHVTYTPR